MPVCSFAQVPPANWPGAPTYSNAEQAIFWVSGGTLPEQSTLVSGAFSPLAKTVRLATLAGASSASSALSGSSLTVPGTRLNSTGLTFVLPKTFPKGPFAFRIEDTSGLALVGTGNLPTIWWSQGIWSSFTSGNAALHEVRVDGVEAGGVLRIFGRDFPPTSQVRLTPASGTATTIAVTTQNPYALTVAIPSGLATGSYTVRVGSSASLDATYGPAIPLTVTAASNWTSSTVTATGLNGNGSFDNTSALQGFLNSNLPAANQVKYISIPTAGTYKITGTITLNPRQYLVGTSGVLIKGVSATPPSTWITGSSYWGLVNIAVEAPISTYVVSSDSTNAGHVTVFGSTITSTGTAGVPQAFHPAGPDIKIVNSTVTGSGCGLGMAAGKGAYLSGLSLNPGSQGYNAFGTGCEGVIFENSTITGLAAGDSTTGMAYFYNANGLNSEKIYTAGITVQTIRGNFREAMTTDAGGGNYQGLLSSVSAGSVTLAGAPSWGPASPSNRVISILAGKGQGQYRRIASASGNTITLAEPWTITPDTSSIVSITGFQRHHIFYGNTTNDTGPGIQLYVMSLESVIANNRCLNGTGIWLYSKDYQTGYPSIMNSDVIANQVYGNASPTNAAGQTQPNVTGIHLLAQASGSMHGVSLRGNLGISSGFLTFEGSNWKTRSFSILSEGPSAPAAQANVQAEHFSAELKENNVISGRIVPGTVRNNANQWGGLKFTVGSRPVTVTHVGRWKISGNTGTHAVKVVDAATNADVPGASASVALSPATVGRFAYAALGTPVTLAADKSYYLLSQEASGGDGWYDSDTRVSGGNGITVNSAAVNNAVAGSASHSCGPVNLIFKPEMAMAQAVSSFGPVRNNFSGWLGLNFTVGPQPLTVTHLGRWVISGNGGSHAVKLTTASGSNVPGGSVTVDAAGATAGQFAYGKLSSPVTLSANTTYNLQSQETSGGDTWYDKTSVVVPCAGITINSAAYNNATAGAGGPNNSYIPVSLLGTY